MKMCEKKKSVFDLTDEELEKHCEKTKKLWANYCNLSKGLDNGEIIVIDMASNEA